MPRRDDPRLQLAVKALLWHAHNWPPHTEAMRGLSAGIQLVQTNGNGPISPKVKLIIDWFRKSPPGQLFNNGCRTADCLAAGIKQGTWAEVIAALSRHRTTYPQYEDPVRFWVDGVLWALGDDGQQTSKAINEHIVLYCKENPGEIPHEQ